MAAALAAIEADPAHPDVVALLDRAWALPRAHVIGLTGPPGVGKSTLTGALIRSWRASGRTVGIIAVDPSSRRTGGALLGDRTRLATDPEDQGIFVRSMAARDRLGGLASLTFAAMVLMRAVYDVVLVETVGVGQSETDVVTVADSVVFCIQPGSGDSLQFMKSGIMEVPHIILVTKADIGPAAVRARADVKGALSLNGAPEGWSVPVLLASASSGVGMDKLFDALEARWSWLSEAGRLVAARRQQDRHWLEETLRDGFGRDGLGFLGPAIDENPDASPFARDASLSARLRNRATPPG
ncbi:methylmalonyl Co-A mutase-associated GTPase MeaB [Iodidimonas sp. SYSU 1G8]|uniref:ArgK/MeaB family GTPase n=1 Tax=Iodidimonas sp. SYSU 1G8 TaxID=3133967 RepID=UPI0031FEBE1E